MSKPLRFDPPGARSVMLATVLFDFIIRQARIDG
jgi:hypothetical protein